MKRSTICFLLLAAFLWQGPSASALTFELNTPFTAAGTGSILQPAWLTATFEDTAGGVQLTLSAAGLPTGSYVSQWYFNIFQNTEIAPPSQQGPLTDPRLQLFLLSPDNLNAGPDTATLGNGFDFSMTFGSAGNVFDSQDTATFLFSLPTGIIADWFNQLNTAGAFYAAANILSLTGGAGSSIAATSSTTPGPAPIAEPASIILLGLGLGGLTVFGRKKLFA